MTRIDRSDTIEKLNIVIKNIEWLQVYGAEDIRGYLKNAKTGLTNYRNELENNKRQLSELNKEKKDIHAVRMGRLGGLKGGPARAKKLSPERRSEIAQKAAEARWKKEKVKD